MAQNGTLQGSRPHCTYRGTNGPVCSEEVRVGDERPDRALILGETPIRFVVDGACACAGAGADADADAGASACSPQSNLQYPWRS